MTQAHITIQQVRAQHNESIDALCYRIFGAAVLATNITEQVLMLNHGLADLGEILPAGTLVNLPQLIESDIKKSEFVQLWE